MRERGKAMSVPYIPEGQPGEFSRTVESRGWTIAYRKQRANRFLRLNINVMWRHAVELAGAVSMATGLEVYYVPTRQAELSGQVAPEDRGNVLVPSGKRIRIQESAFHSIFGYGENHVTVIAHQPVSPHDTSSYVTLRFGSTDELTDHLAAHPEAVISAAWRITGLEIEELDLGALSPSRIRG